MHFRKHLIHEGLLTETELVDMEKAVDEAVQNQLNLVKIVHIQRMQNY